MSTERHALLLYGSTTGNTEVLAEEAAKGLRSVGFEVDVRNVRGADAEEMLGFDLVVLGCSTWDDGELQEDFVPFSQGMSAVDLSGCCAAVFGPGERSFGEQWFCRAVDTLIALLKEAGAEVLDEGLRIDGDIDPHLESAHDWAAEIGRTCRRRIA